MRKIALTLIFKVCIANFGYSQNYTMVDTFRTNVFFDKNINISNVHFKCHDTIMLIVYHDNYENNSLIIKSINLNTGAAVSDDTISGLPNHFRVTDIAFDNKQAFILSDDEYIYFEIKNVSKTLHYQEKNKELTPRYEYCELINDSLALFYLIYDFHPADGMSGLFMHVLDTRTKELKFKLFTSFPAVKLASIVNSWVAVLGEEIFVVNPFTGDIDIYNYELQRKDDRLRLPVLRENSLRHNLGLLNYVDSVTLSARMRLQNIISSYPEDSLRYHINELQSDIYSQEFIGFLIDTLRNNYNYVEKISKYNDSVLAVTIFKHEYGNTRRDFMLYNINTKDIVKHYPKWECVIKDTINKFEDFFPVDIRQRKVKSPFFLGKYIYTGTLYNPATIVPAEKDSVSNLQYEEILKKGYNWTILKYQLSF